MFGKSRNSDILSEPFISSGTLKSPDLAVLDGADTVTHACNLATVSYVLMIAMPLSFFF